MADTLKTNHLKFGRSASKGVHINRRDSREPPKLRSAGAPSGWERGWLQETRLPYTCVTLPNVVVLR